MENNKLCNPATVPSYRRKPNTGWVAIAGWIGVYLSWCSTVYNLRSPSSRLRNGVENRGYRIRAEKERIKKGEKREEGSGSRSDGGGIGPLCGDEIGPGPAQGTKFSSSEVP